MIWKNRMDKGDPLPLIELGYGSEGHCKNA
jgi:hypothetical protein